MVTVHKYQFAIEREIILMVPYGARVLKVECQADVPSIWALVDTNRLMVARRFYLFGTGKEISTHLRHVATFQQGIYVWHLFEE